MNEEFVYILLGSINIMQVCGWWNIIHPIGVLQCKFMIGVKIFNQHASCWLVDIMIFNPFASLWLENYVCGCSLVSDIDWAEQYKYKLKSFISHLQQQQEQQQAMQTTGTRTTKQPERQRVEQSLFQNRIKIRINMELFYMQEPQVIRINYYYRIK